MHFIAERNKSANAYYYLESEEFMKFILLFILQITHTCLNTLFYQSIAFIFSNNDSINLNFLSVSVLDRLGNIVIQYLSIFRSSLFVILPVFMLSADILTTTGLMTLNGDLFRTGWLANRALHGSVATLKNVYLFNNRQAYLIIKGLSYLSNLTCAWFISYYFTSTISRTNMKYLFMSCMYLIIIINFVVATYLGVESKHYIKEIKNNEEDRTVSKMKKIIGILSIIALFVSIRPTDNYLNRIINHRFSGIYRTIGQSLGMFFFWIPNNIFRLVSYHALSIVLFGICAIIGTSYQTTTSPTIATAALAVLWGFLSSQKEVMLFLMMPKGMGRHSLVIYNLIIMAVDISAHLFLVRSLPVTQLCSLIQYFNILGLICAPFLIKQLSSYK